MGPQCNRKLLKNKLPLIHWQILIISGYQREDAAIKEYIESWFSNNSSFINGSRRHSAILPLIELQAQSPDWYSPVTLTSTADN